MWHLLLLSLLSGSLVLPSKVENECAKGAAYWCNNLMTAVQCGALDHCVQTGWNQATNGSVWNRITKEDMCTDCKQLITILMRMAKESTFKKTLQKYLEHECTNLPLQTLIPQCQALVQDYYARLIASLEKQLDPIIVCAQLGACPTDLPGSTDALVLLLTGLERLLPWLQGETHILPSGHTQELPRELLPIPLPLCWLCRTFIGKAESVIPKAAIGKAMSQLCHVLPAAIAGMCQCLMEKYTVIIVDLIVSKLGPRLICGMMFMCAAEENCGPADSPQGLLSASADGCQTCLMISDHAKASLRENSTRMEVEATLLTACSHAFPHWHQCNRFIDQHQPNLSLLLVKPWDSHTTCQVQRARTQVALQGQPTNTGFSNSSREAEQLESNRRLCALQNFPWDSTWIRLEKQNERVAYKWLSLRKKELGACRAEEPFPRATACAQGPAYWCSSLSTARQCKAIQHCQDHVWL